MVNSPSKRQYRSVHPHQGKYTEWNPAGDRLYVTARRLHRWYQSGLPITENFVWTEAVRPGMECGVRQADENQGVSETPIRSMRVYTQTQG